MVEPPVIEMIAEDGVLADTKLIAEPWDAGGLYQVGGFPFGRRWSEWNGRYRDDVRRFWRGDERLRRPAGDAHLRQLRPVPVERPAAAALGQLHHLPRRVHPVGPGQLQRSKHNEANGENNRDGSNENYSWNCGAEGETTTPEVLDCASGRRRTSWPR
jgi:isoamylase